MTKKLRKIRCLFLLLFILLSFPSNNAHGKQVTTGVFGLWALGDWDYAFNLTRDNGFNLVIDLWTLRSFDMAHARGLKGFVRFSTFTPDMINDEAKWQQFLAGVRKKVIELKDHPAVYGWYLVDEPDWQNIPIDKIRQMNAVVRAIDNKHPIMTVLTMPDRWSAYLPYFDIISIDPYLKKNVVSPPDTPQKVQDWIRKVKRDMIIAKAVKPLWVTLGAFELTPRYSTVNNPYLKPTPSQFNQMVDIALKEQVDGILVWTLGLKDLDRYMDWSLVKDDPGLWEAVKQLPSKAN